MLLLAGSARAATVLRSLCDNVNSYRASLGLSLLTPSPTMEAVAAAHADNLVAFHVSGTECTMHSWYDNGDDPPWTPCCYTSTGPYSCIHGKGSELTAGAYTGASLENSFYSRPPDRASP